MKQSIKFLFILFLTISFSAFAQKVKVKKGKVLVDGIEVGIIEAIDKSKIIYAVKDLSGKDLFIVDVDIAEGSTRPFEYNWMTVSSKNYPQINVVDYSMISMSLSHPKIIAEILTKTYGIFSEEGLSSDKIAEFFAEERTSKYKKDATGSGSSETTDNSQQEGFDGKIKVKKDVVLFDDVAVATVKLKNKVYIFSSLDNKNSLDVSFYVAPLSQEKSLEWLGVSDNQGRKTELKMEYLSGNVKQSRAITELLAKKYNVITRNGIDNLDDFYKVERPNLTEEYRIIFNEAKKQAKEDYERNEALIKFRIEEEDIKSKSILSDIEKGLIYFKEGDKELGTVENLKGVTKNDSRYYIDVFDKGKQRIVRFTSNKELDKKEYLLKDYNNKVTKVFMQGDAQFSKPYLYKSIAKVLSENGYDNAVEFGVVRAKEIERERAIEEFFAKSNEAGNLRYAKGYMFIHTKKKSIRREGLITLYFKDIPEPDGVEDIEEGRIMNTNVDGKRLGTTFRFQQVTGKTGVLHKARDNKAFCVYLEDGGEKCYRGKKLGTATYGFVETDSIE